MTYPALPRYNYVLVGRARRAPLIGPRARLRREKERERTCAVMRT